MEKADDRLVKVRDATPADLPAMTALQNALLSSTAIEWRYAAHTLPQRQAWLARQQQRGFPVLVGVRGGSLAGWTSYADFRDTVKWPGYRFTVEHTIHVARSHWRGGTGRRLLTALMERAETAGMHAMIGGIAAENLDSIRFHHKLGFVEVGRLPQVGAKLGRWHDLVLMQRLLDTAPTPPDP